VAKTIAELNAEIDAILPTNNVGAINAAILRGVLHDIVNNETGTGGGGGGTTTFTGTGDLGLTRAQHIATTYTTPPAVIRTTGYNDPGDYGGGFYVKVATQPNHQGRFQTADGTWYELYPTAGEIWIEQFGAIGDRINFNDKSYDRSIGMNAAIDYIVFSGRACDLRIGPGFFYQATTWVLKGNINIRGLSVWEGNGPTMLRPDVNVDSIFGCHFAYTINRNTGVYSGANPYQIGQQIYYNDNFGHTNGTGTGIYKVVGFTDGGTLSVGGGPYNTDVHVGNIGTGGGPSGTANGQVDGNLIFDYVRESTRVERAFGHYTGKIEGINIFSYWNPAQQADGSWNDPTQPFNTACGMIFTDRAWVSNCWIGQMSQHGIAFVADGDPSLPYCAGNVDGFKVESCGLYYNGSDGFHVGYAIANAGYCEHIDVAFSGRWGIAEWSFLGNAYNQVQSAGDGDIRPFLARWNKAHSCVHNGYMWIARLPQLGINNWQNYDTTEPGSDDAVWALYYGDGTIDVRGTATGSISGTVLTVSATSLTNIEVGDKISGTGITPGTRITSFGSGTGGTGTYNLNKSQTASSTTIKVMSMGARTVITGSISGTTLTVTSSSLILNKFDLIQGPGVLPNTRVLSVISSTDFKVGTFTINKSQTVGSVNMTLVASNESSLDANFPGWGGITQFEPGGPYSSNNSNAANVWTSVYVEGGESFCQFGRRDLVLGGLIQQLIPGVKGSIWLLGSWINGLNTNVSYQVGPPANSHYDYSVGIGGQGTFGPRFVSASFPDFSQFGLHGKSPDGFNNWDLACITGNDGTTRFTFTGGNTLEKGGHVTEVLDPGSAIFRGLYVGRIGGSTVRRLDSVDAIGTVTTGSFVREMAKGDVTFVQNADPGRPIGYYCSTAGNPGTHVPFGALGGVKVVDNRNSNFTLDILNGFSCLMEIAGTVTATVPPISSVPFITGTEIEFNLVSAGTMTIAAGSGVTIQVPSGGSLSTSTLWATKKIRKRSGDEWVLTQN
jgi:hypothetical protein